MCFTVTSRFFCRMVEGMWPLFVFYKERATKSVQTLLSCMVWFRQAEDGLQLKTDYMIPQ